MGLDEDWVQNRQDAWNDTDPVQIWNSANQNIKTCLGIDYAEILCSYVFIKCVTRAIVSVTGILSHTTDFNQSVIVSLLRNQIVVC